ncbi:SRPBCC family protein [Amycolatopsis kentuckyensis]|uniref:SRPBCC family protein n=1 Tax=Amycolatopsis kentuckyensis TaxID=218823 RepID=UPI003565438F
MLIENSFEVAADPDEVYRFLQDAHNVAACFPGAELVEDLGEDAYRGKVKIKVGPVTAAYQGVAKVVERDEVARTAVLLADGKDTRGSGTAKARATMRVTPTGEGANVVLATDLTISGKLAQFGRGIMADVSGRMVGELASRVRQRIEHGDEQPAVEHAVAPAVGDTTRVSPPPVAEVPAMKASALLRVVLAGILERWAARLRATAPESP